MELFRRLGNYCHLWSSPSPAQMEIHYAVLALTTLSSLLNIPTLPPIRGYGIFLFSSAAQYRHLSCPLRPKQTVDHVLLLQAPQ
jgi:hypothetical protein